MVIELSSWGTQTLRKSFKPTKSVLVNWPEISKVGDSDFVFSMGKVPFSKSEIVLTVSFPFQDRHPPNEAAMSGQTCC